MSGGPARLRPADLLRLAAAGLRSGPLRVALSAIGVAIGIGTMLAVVGISASSQAEVDRSLDELGTNLLTVAAGESLSGERASLPVESVGMVRRIGPVETVGSTAELAASVYRNDHVPPGQTSSVVVLAADLALVEAVGAEVAAGEWLTPATAAYPGVVLGAAAARRLDVPGPGVRVWLGGRWYPVVGVLRPVPLAPELDSAALVGWESARSYLAFDGHPGRIYVRVAESRVDAVYSVLGRTANPRAPQEVRVSRPSLALEAKDDIETVMRGLLLALGAIALLVGGVGVANTMAIAVLERRAEIGLRRALGATRGQIRAQFLAESLLLCGLGSAGGVVLGSLATGVYAYLRGWPTVVPAGAMAAGVGLTLAVGVLAGLYPATRASRLLPAEAVAAPTSR